MGVIRVPTSPTIYDRILRRIQKQLANRVEIPFEIRLWRKDGMRSSGDGMQVATISNRVRRDS